jgi:hypothetical protein
MKLTLCGSLRFEKEIQYFHEKLAFAGHTIYSMVALPSQKGGNKDWYTQQQKIVLDLLHLSKIEESDGIVVVDIDGYIGESTAREILWAMMRRKYVYYTSKFSSDDIEPLLANRLFAHAYSALVDGVDK